MLLAAASDSEWFHSPEISEAVAKFLVDQVNPLALPKVSYRTLKIGYELAQVHPESWQQLLKPLLPVTAIDPKKLVTDLSKKAMKVKDQVKIFEEQTGLKRRSFFIYRKEALLTK